MFVTIRIQALRINKGFFHYGFNLVFPCHISSVMSFYLMLQLSHIIRKPVYAIYANNKGADKTARMRSLISAFVFAA